VGTVPVTAIILTRDEAVNIGPCLRAMAPVEDVVIVDSGSTDGTLERAREERPGVRVFEHPFLDFGDQRNWALDHTGPRHPWVLFVDADEFCDGELMEEIAAFVADPGDAVGAFVAPRNQFMGKWIRRCSMYPSWQLRLLKRGEVRFRKEGHGQREVTDGPLRYLRHGWRHENFSKGVDQWVVRHDAYSDAEARRLLEEAGRPVRWGGLFAGDAVVRRRALKSLANRLPCRPLLRFLYTYVLRLGFLDGRAGYRYCRLYYAHHRRIEAKLAALLSERRAAGSAAEEG
jgi:glycosyltransferase involved in cell wall biosynthesis